MNEELLKAAVQAEEALKSAIMDSGLKGVTYTAKTFALINRAHFDLSQAINNAKKEEYEEGK